MIQRAQILALIDYKTNKFAISSVKIWYLWSPNNAIGCRRTTNGKVGFHGGKLGL